MSINEKITSLESIIGCPVKADIYDGSEDKYITFTHEDERSALNADNEEKMTITYLQVTLYTTPGQDYLKDKRKIKKELKKLGFCVESIQSWVDSLSPERKRHTVFNINITLPENQED